MVFRTIARVYPHFFRRNIAQLLIYAGIKVESLRFTGMFFVYAVLGGIVVGLYSALLFHFHPGIAIAASIFVLHIIFYMLLMLTADKKGKVIEEVLPEALQIMASNLRAGSTIEQALFLSARDEFGPFKVEITQAAKRITTGREIEDVLLEMTHRIKSQTFQRTIELIVSGIRSGGELASLLEQTASDLRNTQLLDKKVRSSVNMYIIFIFVAAGFGSPLLFGLSSYLVEVLSKNIAMVVSSTTAASTASMPFHIEEVSISIRFIISYSIVALVSTSILASLVLGLIASGKEKNGVKYIFPLIIITLTLFFLTRFVIGFILGDILGV